MNGIKKKDYSPLYFVGILGVFGIYFAAAVGVAYDSQPDIMALAENLDFPPFGLVIGNLLTGIGHARAFAGIALLVVVIILSYIYTTKRFHRKGEEHGSARWAKDSETTKLADKDKPEIVTAKTFVAVDKRGSPIKVKGKAKPATFTVDKNFIMTQAVKLSSNTRVHDLNCNVLVCGGSGSGKTWRFVKPNIMQLNCSYVITDPKGENLQSTGKFLEEAGYNVKVINLIDTRHSFNYNPFHYIYDINESGVKVNPGRVIKMIDVFMRNTKKEEMTGGDQFWDDSATALLTAIAFLLIEEERLSDMNFAGINKMLKLVQINMRDPTAKSPLDLRFEAIQNRNPSSLAVSFYTDFKKAPPETAMSIVMSCNVKLSKFNIPDIAAMTHTDTLELDRLGDSKTALYVIISATDTSMNFLAAMMYTQMFDCLYDRANFAYGGRLPVHVRCILELTVPK